MPFFFGSVQSSMYAIAYRVLFATRRSHSPSLRNVSLRPRKREVCFCAPLFFLCWSDSQTRTCRASDAGAFTRRRRWELAHIYEPTYFSKKAPVSSNVRQSSMYAIAYRVLFATRRADSPSLRNVSLRLKKLLTIVLRKSCYHFILKFFRKINKMRTYTP